MNTKTTRQHDTTGVSEYCHKVQSGEIVVGEFVQLATEQHLIDLVDGHKDGLVWENERAEHILKFFPTFLVLKEEQDGQPFKLMPWQQFIVGSTRGWQQVLWDEDINEEIKVLRFRVCYNEVGKGNGKTPVLAGICVYGLVASGTSQPEIYIAATKMEQAKLAFADCEHMSEHLKVNNPEFNRRLEVQRESIRMRTGKKGSIKPVSSDFRGLSGQRVYIGAIDEFHEHPNDLVYGRLRRGTKGRKQAQIFVITNSGDDEQSACGQNRKAATDNLRNGSPNKNLFAYICTVDEGEDPMKDESCWIKTNPGLGVSIHRHYIREQVQSAEGIPKEEADLRRFAFCEWVGSVNPAFDMAKWDSCQSELTIDDIEPGSECVIGIDLASKLDILALVALFREWDEVDGHSRGGWKAFGKFWIPENSLPKLRKTQNKEIQKWVDDGRIVCTPGSRTDHSYVIKEVKELYEYFLVNRIGFDPHNIGNTDNDIKKWIEKKDTDIDPEEIVVEVPQTLSQLNWGTKELQASIADGRFDTGGCPVLRWMAANTTLKEDDNENCMPSKRNSKGKIDGVAATVIAMTASKIFASEDEDEEEDESVGVSFITDESVSWKEDDEWD